MTADDLSRRTLLSIAALLPVASNTSALAAPGQRHQVGAETMLVACFTRSGNTKVIAGTVQRALSADMFAIRPAQAYPEDYEETVEKARRERDGAVEPPLAEHVGDIASYDTVFLCFPIWGETAPPIIRSFLKTHDMQGKTIRPIITHGGYGLGNSMAVLKSHAPSARVEPPFVMEADQERRTLNAVRGWLDKINAT